MSERLMKIDKGHLAYRRFYVKFVDRTTQLAISEFPCALFQSESKWNDFDLHENETECRTHFIWKVSHLDSFETEAQESSDLACWLPVTLLVELLVLLHNVRRYYDAHIQSLGYLCLKSRSRSWRPGEKRGTPLYGPYRYVRPQRVCFFSHFGHNQGINFSHFWRYWS